MFVVFECVLLQHFLLLDVLIVIGIPILLNQFISCIILTPNKFSVLQKNLHFLGLYTRKITRKWLHMYDGIEISILHAYVLIINYNVYNIHV